MIGSDLLGIAAGLCGVAMGLSPLLTARRALATRSSRDQSVAAVLVILVGASVWLAYGVVEGSAPLIATNLAGVLSASTCLLVAMRLRSADPE